MSDSRPAQRVPADSAAVRALYDARLKTFAEERARLARTTRHIAHARLVAFGLSCAGFVYGLWYIDAVVWWAVAGAVACVVAFGFLVARHDRAYAELTRHDRLLEINREARWRLGRQWDRLARRPVPPVPAADAVARDLDLFESPGGQASLYQLLGTAHTPSGRQTLARWLVEPAGKDTIQARQEAVAELGPQLDWRQELGVRGRQMLDLPPDVGPFLAWAEGSAWLLSRIWLLWVARLLALITLVLCGLNLAGLLPPWWLLCGLVNLLVAALLGRAAHDTFEQLAWRERPFRDFAGLFGPLAETRFHAPHLTALQQGLTADGLAAHQQMRRLDRINGWADVRRSGLVHLVLQALTIWDAHVLAALERWQQTVGPQVRRWLQILGEFEALCALAALHHDHPDWAFPEITDGDAARIEAEDLGHPLLPPKTCVTNPVTVGPAGSFLLVTGSNMSGKSTLLRAIGLNAVLAQAGGPVFARSLKLPLITVGTSFRVVDSLEQGVSTFMAELQRLKDVVDQARAHDGASARRFLFLLDEILQGTNVYERQVAVRQVILHLVAHSAIGAVTTHDLTLAEAEGLAEAARTVHFSETYEETAEGPRMRFDYQLRPGVAPTTNALKLLELVGLGTE